MIPKKILVVDDEIDFSRALCLALGALDMEANHVTTLKQARGILSQSTPDLILLDRMLPDGDGLTWLQEERKKGLSAAVILLTAKGALQDKVAGLEAGADDYLPKPFSFEELSARIRAVLRRFTAASISTANELDHEPWEIDAKLNRIHGPDGWVKLTKLEFRLAAQLIESPGRILSREALLKEVWGFQWIPQTRTVDYFMGRLRRKFEKNPDAPLHFLTHRGLGFEFQK